MTNADLVELIDRSSATLNKLHFSSQITKRALTFGYDLHRQIYGMGNRSAMCIEFEFGDIWDRNEFNTFMITKEGIWEDHKLSQIFKSNYSVGHTLIVGIGELEK